MNIIFNNTKQSDIFNEHSKLVKAFGKKRAEFIEKRIIQLRASPVLFEMRNIRGAHCHELKGKFKGKFAVNLDGSYRLIFEPAENPIPRLEDGGINLNKVQSIKIIKVIDYHG